MFFLIIKHTFRESFEAIRRLAQQPTSTAMRHKHTKHPVSTKTLRFSASRLFLSALRYPLTFIICLLLAAAISSRTYAASVIKVAAGGEHSLFLTDDGTLWGMGHSWYGQLGDARGYTGTGYQTYHITPARVATDVTAMAAGVSHSLFIKSDGSLWAVGANHFGQLGDGTTTNRRVPVQVATGVIAVAAGYSHSLFLKTDGSLWTMGNNRYGQLGDGASGSEDYPDIANRRIPMQIATDVDTIAAGGSHSLFVKSDGTLWVMGWNGYGQLGDGSAANRVFPMQVGTGVDAVAAGRNHSLFVKNDGSLWAMGFNDWGQLGYYWDGGTIMNQRIPAQMAVDVIAVTAGKSHSLLIKSDGSLWGTGLNYRGQLGDDTGTYYRMTPAQITSGVVAMAAGEDHSLFIKTDGSLWAMGRNRYGQLGDGATADRYLPVYIAGGNSPTGAPAITTQPASQTLYVGDLVTFGVVATGSNLTYQWHKDDTDIPGATSASYTITNAQQSHAGSYRVTVSNTVGSTISHAAALVVKTSDGIGDDGGVVMVGGSAAGGGAPSLLWLGVVGSMLLLRRMRKSQMTK
ncbi:immunoglobulin domain-containing protein [Ereboglobus luteus]|uniref:Ig-like domain-containing protein n=1 Tax=Ereboglobus luteus TaxID=1796921 RepID=A0A2U8E0I2_9BACT|nr:immunoglobulin domain-containing protein [Ereboglobus luteus]AWI08340.1 hypothetical protein CKA38_02865 [Ereboglobus luteus]